MKGRRLDLGGWRFGRLVAIERASTVASFGGRVYSRWRCSCDCGKSVIVWTKNLRNRSTRSCGCLHTDSNIITGRKNHKHGHTNQNSPTYRSWRSAINRCHYPKDENYPEYGARGITVCDEWRHDFARFLHDMGERPIGTTLDRIEGRRGYSKDNCRWATPRQQSWNSSRVSFRDMDDNPISMGEIARVLALSPMTIAYRFKKAGIGHHAAR